MHTPELEFVNVSPVFIEVYQNILGRTLIGHIAKGEYEWMFLNTIYVGIKEMKQIIIKTEELNRTIS